MMHPSPFRELWSLDPAVKFLNHGSFGACPIVVQDEQERLRRLLEREPVSFFLRELEPGLDAARVSAAAVLGADPDDVAFVPNATTGVNTVLRSLDFAPGDELLTTDHTYNACRNALEFVVARTGASVIVAKVPFPIEGPEVVVRAVLDRVSARTRLALLDYITSPTALIFPIERLVRELSAAGVDSLVDAAHAPGMLALNLKELGAAYTTGNFHKWTCAPKGAAFLHVRPDKKSRIRPLSISHGANATRTDRSRYRLEFDWTGTSDLTPFLCLPATFRFLDALLPGGMAELRERNRAAALDARRTLCAALGIEPPCPAEMLGAMASVPIAGGPFVASSIFSLDPLQETLFTRFRIEVPIMSWPAPPRRLLRVSTPIYSTAGEIDELASALVELGVTGVNEHYRRG